MTNCLHLQLENQEFFLETYPVQRCTGVISTGKENNGIPSRVILTKTIVISNKKRIRSVIVKVALQINYKHSGAIWSLIMPKAEEVMFVGIKVAHDPLRRHPSVVAMVASLNNEMTCCFSTKVLKVQQEFTNSHVTLVIHGVPRDLFLHLQILS